MLKIHPREGPRPKTTPCAPHTQISQNPDARFHRAFKDRAFDFPFVTRQPSMISLPGAEALCLEHGHGLDPCFVDPNHLTHRHILLLVIHSVAPSVIVEGAVKSDSAKRFFTLSSDLDPCDV